MKVFQIDKLEKERSSWMIERKNYGSHMKWKMIDRSRKKWIEHVMRYNGVWVLYEREEWVENKWKTRK